MTVSADIRIRIDAKLQEGVNRINAHFNENFITPTVAYDVRGQTAGYVTSADDHRIIHLNPIILNENVDAFIEHTPLHELAHWAEYKVWGGWERLSSSKRSVHGRRWKDIMSLLGVDATRCHSFNTATAQVRVKNKFEYECDCCGDRMTVGPVVHKRIQNGQHRWHKGCGRTTRIVYVGDLGQVTYKEAKESRESNDRPTIVPQPRPTPKPRVPRAQRALSKKARAQALYNDHKTHSRELIIQMFMTKLSMTKAGASTYYCNLNK